MLSGSSVRARHDDDQAWGELESQGVELKKEFMQLYFENKFDFEWFFNMNFRAVTIILTQSNLKQSKRRTHTRLQTVFWEGSSHLLYIGTSASL